MFVNSTADGSTTRSLAVYRVHKDTITLPNELACAAYEQRCLAGYFEAYLPNGQALTDKTLQNMLGGWSNTIRDLYNTDEVLRKTTLAMCLATLGRQQGEQWMIEESLKFYIGSLKEMTVALNIPSRARSDAILAATRLFSLFEASIAADLLSGNPNLIYNVFCLGYAWHG